MIGSDYLALAATACGLLAIVITLRLLVRELRRTPRGVIVAGDSTGRCITVESDRHLDADDLRAIAHLLAAVYGTRRAAAMTAQLLDQVVADAAAEVDDDLRRMGGAA